MSADEELAAPPLPVRASIYIAPDGTVHFGALFAELVPVAAALSTPTATQTPTATSTPTSTPTSTSTSTPTSTSTSTATSTPTSTSTG